MKRLWGRALAGATLIAGAAAYVPGCAQDNSTLFIYDVLALPLVSPGTGCTFTNSVAQASIASGVLDLDLDTQYLATYLIGNQMIAQANPNASQTETSFIQIQGAVVTIKDASGTQQLAQYTDVGSTTIPPASGGTPSYGSLGVTTVDYATGQNFGPPPGDTRDIVRVLTFVHFYGVTLGGQSVQSNEYEFPVDLCRDCLVSFSSADINPAYESPNCVGNGQAAVTSAPCIIGQDEPVDCSLCIDISPDCDPTPIPIGTTTSSGVPEAGADSSTPPTPPPVEAGADSSTTAEAGVVDAGAAEAGVADDAGD